MAAKTIRSASILVNSRKVAECESNNYDVASGDEAQVGTDGYLGHSDGATMSKLTLNAIIPVAGMEIRVKTLIDTKAYCTVSVIVDGDAEQVVGRFVSRSYASDSKAGSLKGVFNFEGGEPVY
jgi:hypothetical protein